ncbi:hypothetical protein GQ457_12G009690 [Hibiscus cannabinus]
MKREVLLGLCASARVSPPVRIIPPKPKVSLRMAPKPIGPGLMLVCDTVLGNCILILEKLSDLALKDRHVLCREVIMTSHVLPHPSEEFIGHSFSYVRIRIRIRPHLSLLSSAENHSSIDSSSSSSSTATTTTRFSSISGASVCANLTTVPLAAASLRLPDNSSTFKSSDLSNGSFKSKKKGWFFIKSFNFKRAKFPHHLLTNLFNAVFEELRGLLWNNKGPESDEATGFNLKKWKCDYNSQRCNIPMF